MAFGPRPDADSPSGPFFNASDFGAKGDGVADDTDAILATLAAASAANGSVVLAVGSYVVRNGVRCPSCNDFLVLTTDERGIIQHRCATTVTKEQVLAAFLELERELASVDR